MTTSNDMHIPEQWGGRLTPSDVHTVLFNRAGLGRRGYDEVEVDVFLERVQQELTRLISEKADLRDEVSRLRSQLSQSGAAPSVAGTLSREEANLQAVRLLAAAQQTADVYVADAEKYSQRLTLDAREHCDQMVEEARRAAQLMVAEAERLAREAASDSVQGSPPASSGLTQQELDQQVAYLKTFGQVVRVQLKAYLEALLRDVEEEWGRADPAVVGASSVSAAQLGPVAAGAPAPALGPAVDGAVLDPHRAGPVPSPATPEHRDAAEPAGAPVADDAANGTRPPRGRKRTTVSLHSH